MREARKKVSALEFDLWALYFDQEATEPTVMWTMVARVAYEVALLRYMVTSMFARPGSVPLFDDFMPKFDPKVGPENTTTPEVRARASQDRWLAFAGFGKDGKRLDEEIQTRKPPVKR